MKKIDITSTAVEKGFDIAKGFVEKLINPPSEELGLLLKEGIAKWRFENQIKLLIKARSICEKHGVNPKVISPKLLCPLLDYAGLEEDEKLQDKWATLLANMVDSEQNVNNHVFPYLLSQVSVQEFNLLESTFIKKQERVKALEKDLSLHLETRQEKLKEFENEMKEIEKEIARRKENNLKTNRNYIGYHELESNLFQIKQKKSTFEKVQNIILNSIAENEMLENEALRDYEISNLIRLGLIKELIRSYGYVESRKVNVTKNHHSYYESDDFVNLDDLSVTIETEKSEFELTELGELFINACLEKK